MTEWGIEEGGQQVQTSSYKISMSPGCDVQHGDCSRWCCMTHRKVAERENATSSHHKEEGCPVSV